jgi:hypothetical protein
MGTINNGFGQRIIKSTSFKTPAPAPLQTTFLTGTSKIDIIIVYGRNNFEDKAIASSSPQKSGFPQVVRNQNI